ncbi:helix-turn-helix transcriptional regulator [Nonomuraea africana]|uniref:AraC-like DNA-binding protein n=1 Tax=Nonomuraea africana TaxID=46171 RepID=A0ABR9KCN9_9ACTN|nr:AraC family transcriptional regulator [Nonomuraea africana]MBE1559590.1 AraC-like DNA-binding protein [Nonomuraea africana]
MRSARRLGIGPGFTVTAVTCVDDHRRWSSPEVGDDYRLVLVRTGRFRRMTGDVASLVDPTMAYLGVPGEEERFAHPAGGDVCTSLSLSPALWRSLTGDGRGRIRPTVYVDARVELAHRALLTATRSGDPGFALTERLLRLLSAVLRQSPSPQPTDSTRPTATAAKARLVTAAREAIAAGHPAADGLIPLAELLGASPYQLSRSFTREMGVSLTHYRNRVRVGRALDRLEDGATSLAALAVELGFADQAHLTRTVRRHLGHTPTALRRLLTGSSAHER